MSTNSNPPNAAVTVDAQPQELCIARIHCRRLVVHSNRPGFPSCDVIYFRLAWHHDHIVSLYRTRPHTRFFIDIPVIPLRYNHANNHPQRPAVPGPQVFPPTLRELRTVLRTFSRSPGRYVIHTSFPCWLSNDCRYSLCRPSYHLLPRILPTQHRLGIVPQPDPPLLPSDPSAATTYLRDSFGPLLPNTDLDFALKTLPFSPAQRGIQRCFYLAYDVTFARYQVPTTSPDSSDNETVTPRYPSIVNPHILASSYGRTFRGLSGISATRSRYPQYRGTYRRPRTRADYRRPGPSSP